MDVEKPNGNLASEEDELHRKREWLRSRLKNGEMISFNETETDDVPIVPIPCYIEIWDDKNGIMIYRSKKTLLSNLEDLIIPYITMLVNEEEIPLLNLGGRLDFKLSRICDFVCAIIRVSSFLFVKSHGWRSWKVKDPSYDDMETVSRALLGANSVGEKVKLKIGNDTVQTQNIGRYLIEGKSSINVCKEAK